MTSNGKKKLQVKLPIMTERFMLTLLRLLSSPSSFSKKSLNNIEYLFELIDINYYKKDIVVYALIQATLIAVNYRQRTQDFKKDTLLTEIDASLTDQFKDQKENLIIPTIINSETANDNEVKTINNMIESYLKYSTILLSKEKVFDALTDFSSGDIANLQDSINKYRDIINSVSEDFRRTDNMNTGNVVHSLDEDYFNILIESYESLRNPKHTLTTGLKMFNQMLSEHGGFLIPSYVILYASINSFKSALLQYCVKWIRKYNSDKYLKLFQETGKIPTILFYSFENTRKENAQREFTMETGKNLKDIEDPHEVKKLWDQHYHSTDSIINVATVYAEAGTIKVSDMRRQIHALNDSGYKVISVIVDYLELIRPEDEDARLDNRLKLGYISNGLHVMSISEEILVLTAQQMNRSAEATMSDLREKNVTNIVKSLNRQYIGESYAIDKPVDLSMYLALERSIFDNKLYMTLKRDKCRYRLFRSRIKEWILYRR